MPPAETTVFRGDHLMLECDYSTKSRDQPTFGGLSTREEMCLAFILYYPRSSLADCRSLPALNTVTSALGIDDVYGQSFQRLVEFMKDIGGADIVSNNAAVAESTLENLLNSLAAETGAGQHDYHVPSKSSLSSSSRRIRPPPLLSSAASAGPLTEADILAKPFYTVAEPEPEPVDASAATSGTNYRTMLMELLLQLRVRAPAALHNQTLAQVLESIDWERMGPQVGKLYSMYLSETIFD